MRTLGWLLIVFAVVILGRDCAQYFERQSFAPTPLGQLWYMIDSGSLNQFQALIERQVAVWLWHDGIGAFLALPAWISLPSIGVICIGIARLAEEDKKRRQVL
jgi:hypothetical protein